MKPIRPLFRSSSRDINFDERMGTLLLSFGSAAICAQRLTDGGKSRLSVARGTKPEQKTGIVGFAE